MTLTKEELARDYGCKPKAQCSDTNFAWKQGCRHPAAIEAHAKWLARAQADRELVRERAESAGCTARRHGTRKAYEVAGCRCKEAVDAKRRHYRKYKTPESERAWQLEYERVHARARKATGGRLHRDPRWAHRMGSASVSSSTVTMLVNGWIPGEGTTREKMVAYHRLAARRVWDDYHGQWTKVPGYRPMLNSEIGRVLGIGSTALRNLRKMPDELRALRTERRLADSRWKVAVAAASAGRKEAERARHARLRAERDPKVRRRLREAKLRARRTAERELADLWLIGGQRLG